ncbi:MAG: integrase core domain-containing protein [Acidimicrobiales bacterium]
MCSHSGRASRARGPRLGELDPPGTSQPRSRTGSARWTDLEGVPHRPGERHLGHRLLRRGHHRVQPALCAVRDRAPEPSGAHPRGHRSSDRLLRHPGCPQPRRRSHRARSVVPVLDPRPRREVHRQLRRGVRLRRYRGDQDTGEIAPRERGRDRWVRTVREECLDWTLVLGRNHLEAVLRDYVRHYNQHRPHRGLRLEVPARVGAVTSAPPSLSDIGRRDVLGGLIHESRAAA